MTNPVQFSGGARLIIVFEFVERFGFYSMLSLFAIYLTSTRDVGGLGWDIAAALRLVGLFSGLMYALPLVGGFIADRLFGHRPAILIGGVLMMAGYTGLAFPDSISILPERSGIYAALGLLVLGNALIKSTLVTALGDTFSDGQAREAAYAWYYAGINLGGLVAGLATGAAVAWLGWPLSFLPSALAMALAVGTFGLLAKRLLPDSRQPKQGSPNRSEKANNMALRFLAIALLAAILLVYTIGSFQLYGTTLLMLDGHVDRRIGNFVIPTQWFTAVQATVLIGSAPLFALLWRRLAERGREPDLMQKYVVALVLGACGLLMLAAVGRYAVPGQTGWWALAALGVASQSAGEVAAWVSTYGTIYRLAPPRMVSATMGAFYAVTLGCGSWLAGWFGQYAEMLGFGTFFLWMSLATLATAIVSGTFLQRFVKALAIRSGGVLV